MKNATLTYDPDRKGFKAIHEIEGSGQRFYPSKCNKIPVRSRKATLKEMVNAIAKVTGLPEYILNKDQQKLFGIKFRDEICQDENNNIAWDECTSKGFLYFEIVEK